MDFNKNKMVHGESSWDTKYNDLIDDLNVTVSDLGKKYQGFEMIDNYSVLNGASTDSGATRICKLKLADADIFLFNIFLKGVNAKQWQSVPVMSIPVSALDGFSSIENYTGDQVADSGNAYSTTMTSNGTFTVFPRSANLNNQALYLIGTAVAHN